MSYNCSIGLRCRDRDGLWFTLFLCSSNYSVTTRAQWMGVLSSYGGIAIVAKIMGNWVCPAFLYMTLSIMECYSLRNFSGTTPVWKHLLSIHTSVSFILAVASICTFILYDSLVSYEKGKTDTFWNFGKHRTCYGL